MLNPDQFYGAGDVDALFHESPMTTAPWPRAGRRKSVRDYDSDRVKEALRAPVPRLSSVDPRTLSATQSHITRAGVKYYMGPEYQETGRTFADQGNVGNRHPVVYRREDGAHMLLSGHHRAASALLLGRQFEARLIEGPWGPPRGGS